MSKLLVVCTRTGAPLPAARIAHACALMGADNLPASQPEMLSAPGLVVALVPPSGLVPRKGTSICLGQMFGPSDGWHEPGGAVPDGTFALLRASDARLELVSDMVGSRSVFYALEGDLFVASSSQRAIVAVLGSFEPDPRALPWMLSAGSLGPEAAWDARIRRLGADARVTLDRATWRLERSQRPAVFAPERRPAREQAARLAEAIGWTCDRLDLSAGSWCLPLSGGVDSRALLLHLARRLRVRCITWGLESSLADPENDASVASAIARAVGAPHQYLPTDRPDEPVDVIFGRFLANGDGCVDHIGAYTDGFAIWRHLHGESVAGIIRGDEGCGWEHVVLEPDVRRVVGASMLSDFFSRRQLEALGLPEQTWPADLARAPGESLPTWRDRLYHTYRIPVVLAALTDLKSPYVEVVNPLLSRAILEVVRTLPDRLRTEKKLFRKHVEALSPPVPFARRSAIGRVQALLGAALFLDLARREIALGAEEGSLPRALAEYLTVNLPIPEARKARDQRETLLRRVVVAVRESLPRSAHSALRAFRPRLPTFGSLAFRAAIVSRMTRELRRAAGP